MLFAGLPWSAPSIVLEEDGIELYASSPRINTRIPWRDINYIKIKWTSSRYYTGKVVIISLHNPKKYGISPESSKLMLKLTNTGSDEHIYIVTSAMPSVERFVEVLKNYPVNILER